ncbi:LTA synthase family protein [Clostridium phoceensis]|uniref:LTA synthase family protein n=1 Tax=Clostridium phoceensis TaxID=1650661 RepID=UPI00265E56D6|nr:LTA synthase family protein [Clostridium phoceensis]
MSWERMTAIGPAGENRWSRWRRLLVPSLFFAGVIYYEELFLKLFCFHAVTPVGALFTLLFTLPIAILLGLLCGGVAPRKGRVLLLAMTLLLSVWMGAQSIYYHLFKTFLTAFSLTKMGMVAGAFGDMAVGEILLNWFPIAMMAVPFGLAVVLRRRLIPEEGPMSRRMGARWALLAAVVQLAAMGIVMCCGGGSMSLRFIYLQAAVPELEVQNFGMLTQNQLELRRVLFGITPEDQSLRKGQALHLYRPASEPVEVESAEYSSADYHILDIDFDRLIAEETDEDLLQMHTYFSQQVPTAKNEWTGYFQGKNLIWIVAEGFCTLAMDPERTPVLYEMAHSGFVFDHFYTPLWGVSTSDGEYTTTTGLIPKSGVWSYSQSAGNYMPFGFGNQFSQLGYRTMAFHDYLYTYYDRDKSFPNMGYEYYALGHGLELEEIWPPSDLEMMEEIVPMFVDEEQFMVYCLTVSGHLNYTYEENAMSRRHWDEVAGLPYSEGPKAYLACQMELELAMESLLTQLEEAGRLDDTVIVLSGDHYPYGLTDEEYSELLGRQVDPNFEIFQNTLILWNAQMEEPVRVEKLCSSLDVMPTLANLFGLEYDSRLMAGRDILSDEPGLVIFSNYSFLTEEGAYNSVLDEFRSWDGSPPDEAYVQSQIAEVQNRVAYSAMILDHDYYRVALNGPPREEGSLFSAHREPQPDSGWLD